MKFHCQICDQNFKRFFLFEGHYEFNKKCREKQELFLQCYICCDMFRTSAALKYHMHQHTIKRARRLTPIKIPKLRELRPVIPKITLEKQWIFKSVTEEKDVNEAVQEPVNTSQTASTVENSECTENVRSVTNGMPKSNIKLPNRRQCDVCKIVLRHGGKRLGKYEVSLRNISYFHIKNVLAARHKQHHIDGKYKCEICDIKFSMVSLVWHRRYFHKDIPKQLKTKKKKQKVGGNNDMKNGRCKICQAVVKRSHGLCDSMTNFWSRFWYFDLSFSSSLYFIQSLVPQHLENHRSGKFRCGICNIRFSQRSFKWHRRRFHPEIASKRKCTICQSVLSCHDSLSNSHR